MSYEPGLVGRSVEEVDSECNIGMVVAKIVEDGRHNVDLLGDAWTDAGLQVARGVEEEDGHTDQSQFGLVLWTRAEVGVIGGEDEEGVLVPRLLTGGLEESLQGMIGVADALMHDVIIAWFVNIDIAIALRHYVWVV